MRNPPQSLSAVAAVQGCPKHRNLSSHTLNAHYTHTHTSTQQPAARPPPSPTFEQRVVAKGLKQGGNRLRGKLLLDAAAVLRWAGAHAIRPSAPKGGLANTEAEL